MVTTFITTLKALIRDRDVLLWAVALPLVLATLFHAMFNNLDEFYQLDPLRVIIVQDAHYQAAEPFAQMIENLASAEGDDSPLLAPTFVASEQAALRALEESNYLGYITVNRDGDPAYFMDMRRGDSVGVPYQAILMNLLDFYLQDKELITSLIKDNPQILANPTLLENLMSEQGATYTTQISITENETSDALRYYYVVLAFSTIMMATFALGAVERVLANTSPLGARRSVGGQSKIRTLVPTLSAAWLLSFACVMVGFIYLRFIFGVNFGGNEPAVILTLAVSALAATFLGALFGSLPLPSRTKSGFVALSSCLLSLFAGLYGPLSQDLGDTVARELPLFAAINPVRQVTDAFFSLYYFDGYDQLGAHLVNLLILSLVFFTVATLIMRRKRYASL